MLKSLHIENYVLIDSLDVEFQEGLIIITGQTGAGKSILLGALSLLTGAKADANLIAEGADNLVVEAEFCIDIKDSALKELLEEAEIEFFDDACLLVRRVVSRSGRSRSFINDSPVSAGVLTELASYLIDIHSQHQNLLLSQSRFQLSLLDYFGSTTSLKEECAELFSGWRLIEKELKSKETQLEKGRASLEYNKAQFDALDRAKLVEGEYEELEQEQKELASAEQIKSLLGEAEVLSEVGGELKSAQKALDKVANFWTGAQQLSERLQSAKIEIEDIAYEVASKNATMGVSEQRLAEVEDRLSLLHQLMRKYGVQSIGELIELREVLRSNLNGDEELAEKVEELRAARELAQKKYMECAQKLHQIRLEAAPKLAQELQSSIRALELEKAMFEVELSECAPSENGIDACCFKFDSNGRKVSELAKCASGGEMSRIMLCIKEMMSRYAGMPSVIFDEIDTGVSGSVAHKMGALICQMGQSTQVFAITHLPQVAAKGMAHYMVVKSEKDGRNVSSLHRLDEEGRLHEIARLLSGEHISDEAIANAKALIRG